MSAVVAVGLLGGIAGVVFDPEVANQKPPSVPSPGDPATGGDQATSTASASAAEQTEASLGRPTNETQTTATAAGKRDDIVTIGGVDITVPKGWKVLDTDDPSTAVLIFEGMKVLAYTRDFDSTADAGANLNQFLDLTLGTAYTQVVKHKIVGLAP